jgi:hypothetical protein
MGVEQEARTYPFLAVGLIDVAGEINIVYCVT